MGLPNIVYSDDYKCLTVRQPWSELIRSGRKSIETRTWNTPYRGPLLITSSKKEDIRVMDELGIERLSLPLGQTICMVDLIDVRLMTINDEEAAQCLYSPGTYAWMLANVMPLEPHPIKGALGLFKPAERPVLKLEI